MPYDTEGRFVSMNDALDAWEPFAVALLTEKAMKYNGFVTYKQLGDAVQAQSSVKHDGLLTNWIGSLLGRVIDYCVSKQTPQLGALCVKEDGTVGEGYRHAAAVGGQTDEVSLDELDDHAARTRLECYRYFGAELPPDGGEPTLTPKAKASRDWKKRRRSWMSRPRCVRRASRCYR